MKKKLKDILKESNVWDRKFGESLPTLKDTAARYAAKQNVVKEGSSKYKHSTKLIAHRMKTEPGAAKGWFGDSWAKALLKNTQMVYQKQIYKMIYLIMFLVVQYLRYLKV